VENWEAGKKKKHIQEKRKKRIEERREMVSEQPHSGADNRKIGSLFLDSLGDSGIHS
jgi:hypothetical protein